MACLLSWWNYITFPESNCKQHCLEQNSLAYNCKKTASHQQSWWLTKTEMAVNALETDTSLPLVCPLMRILFRLAVFPWKRHLKSLSSTSNPNPPPHPTPPPGFNPIPQFSPFLFRLEQATSASLCVLGVPVKHQTLAQCPDSDFPSSYQLLSDHKTRSK